MQRYVFGEWVVEELIIQHLQDCVNRFEYCQGWKVWILQRQARYDSNNTFVFFFTDVYFLTRVRQNNLTTLNNRTTIDISLN